MTKYSKEILSNPKKLREKLEIYLGSRDSVETYAKAIEKFFTGKKLQSRSTWSWYAFFFGFAFFAHRKCYSTALVAFLSSFIPFIHILWASNAKYRVATRFVKILDKEDDEMLKDAGGESPWGFLSFSFVIIIFAMLA